MQRTDDSRCLHFSHAVWQVGRDSGEAFPSTVHNVVAAGAHGGTGAAADAARLQAGGVLVTWGEASAGGEKQTQKVRWEDNGVRGEKLLQVCEHRWMRSLLNEHSMTLSRITGRDCLPEDLRTDTERLLNSCGALPLPLTTSTLGDLQTQLQIRARSQGAFDIGKERNETPQS